MSTKTKRLEGMDRVYGWEYGCDGFLNATEGAELLGISQGYLCRLLRELREQSARKPRDKTWPLRAGRPEIASGPTDQWHICKRSLMEYKKRREPVEC